MREFISFANYLWKQKKCLACIFDIMVADDLATHGAKASTNMVLVSSPEGFICMCSTFQEMCTNFHSVVFFLVISCVSTLKRKKKPVGMTALVVRYILATWKTSFNVSSEYHAGLSPWRPFHLCVVSWHNTAIPQHIPPNKNMVCVILYFIVGCYV